MGPQPLAPAVGDGAAGEQDVDGPGRVGVRGERGRPQQGQVLRVVGGIGLHHVQDVVDEFPPCIAEVPPPVIVVFARMRGEDPVGAVVGVDQLAEGVFVVEFAHGGIVAVLVPADAVEHAEDVGAAEAGFLAGGRRERVGHLAVLVQLGEIHEDRQAAHVARGGGRHAGPAIEALGAEALHFAGARRRRLRLRPAPGESHPLVRLPPARLHQRPVGLRRVPQVRLQPRETFRVRRLLARMDADAHQRPRRRVPVHVLVAARGAVVRHRQPRLRLEPRVILVPLAPDPHRPPALRPRHEPLRKRRAMRRQDEKEAGQYRREEP